MNIPMSRVLSELEEKALEAKNESNRLQKLMELFPDLERHVGRWGRIVYSSKSVNARVDNCFLRHNCGCCNDSPLEAWPYLKTEFGDVYSSPAQFFVGEKHWIAGDKPYEDWEQQLKDQGIPQVVIDKIEAHFESGKQKRRDCVDED